MGNGTFLHRRIDGEGVIFLLFAGEENFLKEGSSLASFFVSSPQSHRAQCTSHKERSRKVFVHLFQKVVGSQGDALRRTPQSAKYSVVRKTQERVNFFAEQRKRENPRRGFFLTC